MKNWLITICGILFLFNYAQAQPTQIGLMCVGSGEPPIIVRANLSDETSQYFSLSQNTWKRFDFTEVRIDELILMPQRVTSKTNLLTDSYWGAKGLWKIHVDRTTLEWVTRITVDMDDNQNTIRRGSCTVHTTDEINQIAAREYSRLNNTRAF